MKLRSCVLLGLGLLWTFVLSADEVPIRQQSVEKSKQLVPLSLKLPAPTMKGPSIALKDLPSGPDIEPWPVSRPPFLVPAGVTNVALLKKVTSNGKPFTGSLSLVTDGDKEPWDRSVAEFRKGIHWVQIDLEADYDIYALVFWLDHRAVGRIHQGVIVAVADDESFASNVRVLFNNDRENLAGLGVGKDKRYFETHLGKLVDAKAAKARYVRVYANGSNLARINCFTEIEVWALPAKR